MELLLLHVHFCPWMGGPCKEGAAKLAAVAAAQPAAVVLC